MPDQSVLEQDLQAIDQIQAFLSTVSAGTPELQRDITGFAEYLTLQKRVTEDCILASSESEQKPTGWVEALEYFETDGGAVRLEVA